jgi:hypothetical protein
MNSIENFLLDTFVCLVLDHSGSMKEEAGNTPEAKLYSSNSFSCAGAKLCATAAPNGLYLGIVKFDGEATAVQEPIQLTDSNRGTILDAIDTIEPRGATNIFAGIDSANRMINKVRDVYGITRSHIILLTDGEDYTLNESNLVHHLSRYAVNGEYPFTMDTIGFGSKACTQILVKMASLCGGNYALCYDASMVGTIFGRAIARTYLGSQAFGIYETDQPHSVEYYTMRSEYHRFREKIANMLLANYRMLVERASAVATLNAELTQWITNAVQTEQTDPDWFGFICALHSDLEGEIHLGASNPDNWTRWGKAYWQMMGTALQKQYAPHFRDASLQIFGSKVAKDEYARIMDICNEMPAPKPKPIVDISSRFGQQMQAQPVYPNINATMQTFSYGGCFHPESKVLLHTGEHVSFRVLEQIVKSGERIFLHSSNRENDQIVELEVLVKTDTNYGPTQLCKIGSENPVVLTPTHPIMIDGQWVHPKTVTEIYSEKLDCVYNVILRQNSSTGLRAQSILVNGYECVGLAHGIKQAVSSVAYDTFWGSEEIVNIIKGLYFDQYNTGLVNFTRQFKRNNLTGWVDSVYEEV